MSEAKVCTAHGGRVVVSYENHLSTKYHAAFYCVCSRCDVGFMLRVETNADTSIADDIAKSHRELRAMGANSVISHSDWESSSDAKYKRNKQKEREALGLLRKLDAIWPSTLRLFAASGTLHVMRNGEDGMPVFTERTSGGVDPDFVVEDYNNIKCDGGDW